MPETSPDPKNARKLDEATASTTPLDPSQPDLASSGASVGADPRHSVSDARLGGELIGAAPSLPAGRREAVLALLTGLMADRERLDDYQGSLKSMFKDVDLERSGPAESRAVDERDERIAAEGFSWLPDEELAALAVSPRALEALYRLLEEPETETGRWLMDAMMAAHADDPRIIESENRTRERIARLTSEGDAGKDSVD